MNRLERAVQALEHEHRRVAEDADRETRLGERILERATQGHGGRLPDHLHLAARFHFPISPGSWRKAQWRLLQESGYTLAEARRIGNLMERHRCLDGDTEMRFLMEHTGHALVSDGIIPRSDPMWHYHMNEIYAHLPPPVQEAARAVDADLPMVARRVHDPIHSQVLGTSVDAGDPYRAGYPNVHLPVLGHAVELSIVDDEIADAMGPLDAALRLWLGMGQEHRALITGQMVAYKHIIGESCGDHTPRIDAPEDIWQHVDLNWAWVESRNDGLRLKIGEGCEWEPEHGVMITIACDGRILEVGEVG